MKNEPQNKEFIERLNAREDNAIEEAFHRYYAALCFFCNKIINDHEATKDIVQEVFARLFEKKHYKYENTIALKTFLYNSVHNAAIDHIRLTVKSRKAIYDNQLKATEYTDIDIEFFKLESDSITKVFEAVERLPESCRAIFKMSYLDRMSVREIAEQLNISENTVKTQRQRAKNHLRVWLKDINFVINLMFF